MPDRWITIDIRAVGIGGEGEYLCGTPFRQVACGIAPMSYMLMHIENVAGTYSHKGGYFGIEWLIATVLYAQP